MADRITKRTVSRLFYRYVSLRIKKGLNKNAANILMQEGSDSAGIAWKIYNGDTGEVYLRMTTNTREAYLMLSAAVATLEELR